MPELSATQVQDALIAIQVVERAKGFTDGRLQTAFLDNLTLEDRLEPRDVAAMMIPNKPRRQMTVGPFDDGERFLFYPRLMHLVYGAPTSGKTLLMQKMLVDELRRGNKVMWLDGEEDDEEPMADRLMELGADAELVANGLLYFQIERPLSPENRDMMATMISEEGVSLVVLDSAGEFMGDHGKQENDDKDVQWLYDYMQPLARAGAAVVIIDHPPKSDRSTASGSKRKGARPWVTYSMNLDCHSFEDDVERAFSRRKSGFSRVFCTKDRGGTWMPGELVAQMNVTPGSSRIFVDIDADSIDDLIEREPVNRQQVSSFDDRLAVIEAEMYGMPLTALVVKNLLHLEFKKDAQALLDQGVTDNRWSYSREHNAYVIPLHMYQSGNN